MPEITRFGPGKASDHAGADGVTWFDIDLAVDADREWLMTWREIDERTRTALLEPVRFSQYERVPDGTLLSVRTLRSAQTEEANGLADLKLLIGPTRAVTLRSGALVAVDELRQHLSSERTLLTAVDLLGFLVSAMTNRMEGVIYELTRDIDDVEDALLDGGSVPGPQTLSELRRRIFRTRRQVHSTQQVLGPMTTDPALALDHDDRKTLDRASDHVTRYLGSLDECRTRVQMLEDQIEAQRSDTMTRSSLNLTIVATVFLPLSFITGLLGMNVGGIPEEHNPLGFWLVTALSVIVSLVAWRLLRRQTYDRYLPREISGKKKPKSRPGTSIPPGRSISDGARSAVALEQPPGERDPHIDHLHDAGGRRRDRSDEARANGRRPGFSIQVLAIHLFAVLIALALFYFHIVVIFDVAGEILAREAWLLEQLGTHAGKVIILGCFFLLFAAHLAEAVTWGLFLRGSQLLPSLTEGVYFSAASITTLGFGDVLLKYPWRHLGTLIAISGVLMFGCSTAFLFVILQAVWARHLVS